ncbi:MAG: TonB protein [Ignavibacteria bacterium]|nr:MAG: TonB protein [Ignavibacteria bacterium]KAF0160740.1 MAG: TonB protein [Ignavibacteria bacterium]
MKTTFSSKLFNLLFIITFFTLINFSNANANTLLPGDEEYEIGIEKAPAPIGGNEAISRNINYPQTALRSKTEGKVYCLALINQNGEVDDVKIVKGLGSGCDEEAVRAIKKTKFTPGHNLGVNVKAKLALAVQFKLP